MELKGKIQNGGPVFTGGPIVQQRIREFFKQNEGKFCTITINDRESEALRRFFEGGIVKFWFYQHPYSGWKTFADARENLKMEFNSRSTTDKEDKSIVVAKSTMMSKKHWQAFLDTIEVHCLENAIIFPNCFDYMQWLDSAPINGEEYPPLQKLKDSYENRLKAVVAEDGTPKPWRKTKRAFVDKPVDTQRSV